MTQEPKKYIHPNKKYEAIWSTKRWYYITIDWLDVAKRHDNTFVPVTFDEKDLLALWFVELPTTDTGDEKDSQMVWWSLSWYTPPKDDWIAQAYNEYSKVQMSNTDNIKWKKNRFRAAINKFMPKPVEPVLIPVTSTIEEQIKRDLEQMMYSHITSLRSEQTQVERYKIADYRINIWKDKWFLSSLTPMGKKRTEKEIREHFWIEKGDTSYNSPSYKRNQMIWARIFLKNHNMYQE